MFGNLFKRDHVKYRNKMLSVFAEAAPDSFLDKSVAQGLHELVGMTDEEFRPAIHEVLDRCAFESLASDAIMRIFDDLWKAAGGQLTDPAPWRSNAPWKDEE